ncbi:MAG: (2E,6E)-farnesyl diphosphate synthase [Rhodomicrobium sp.]|nr:MAG: (2E,6E)-farnesyl diphosphate synthase [Rhodomicrobium sp.]
MDEAKFKAELERIAKETDQDLKALFGTMSAMGTENTQEGAIFGGTGLNIHAPEDVPLSLKETMSYAALSGGKRFRPFLVHASSALFNAEQSLVKQTALAVECIHCYSLVHDDLPAMDNDELRRGQPTLWKWRDEAAAILAGDSLQSLAFEILSANPTPLNALPKAKLVNALAAAAGKAGMVGGQVRDLEAETKSTESKNGSGEAAPANFADVITIHSQKTGALISFSAESGAIIGGADEQSRAALRLYGEKLGLAFQLRDDILDIEGSAEELGKTPGKDEAAGKATFITALGLEKAKTFLENLHQGAIYALEPFGEKADHLRAAATFVCKRNS